MNPSQWKWTLEKSIPSVLDDGHAIIEELILALQRSHWNDRDVFHIHMAIEEAVVNAIQHGNKSCADKQVFIHFRVSPDEVWMQVTDQGAGFNPNALPDPTADENLSKPRGRGVMLVHELMTEATYNERGNSLTMIKRRSQACSE